MSIVVVDDDWRDQLDRYQSLEYAAPSNRHIVNVDRLSAALKAWPRMTSATFRLPDGREVPDIDDVDPALLAAGVPLDIVDHSPPGREPFLKWVRTWYGVSPLQPGALPDLEREHRFGWIRVDSRGLITELIEREIPGAFFFWFRGTVDNILLKPDGIGWNVDEHGAVTEVATGRAGSARLRHIDFDGMRADPYRFWPHDVIRHGEHLESPADDALLASLAPDTLVTSVYVKA